MPALTNPRHEKFCQGMAEGKTARKAYMDAGYICKPSAADGSAAALRKNPLVQARMLELSELVADRVVARAAISKQWLEDKVQDLAEKAERSGQLAVAKACYELLGRDRNVFAERRNITVRSIAELTEDELLDELARIKSRDTAPADRGDREGTSASEGRKKPPRRLGGLLN